MTIYKNYTFEEVTELIRKERKRQKELSHGGNTDDFDSKLSANDFISLTISYLGRATQKSFRNEREKQSFEENIIKAIALLYSSLENHSTSLK